MCHEGGGKVRDKGSVGRRHGAHGGGREEGRWSVTSGEIKKKIEIRENKNKISPQKQTKTVKYLVVVHSFPMMKCVQRSGNPEEPKGNTDQLLKQNKKSAKSAKEGRKGRENPKLFV